MTNAKDAQRAFGTCLDTASRRRVAVHAMANVGVHRQMRFPELEFASDASIALITYLAKKAEGGTFDAPAIKAIGGEMQPKMILALALCGIGSQDARPGPPIPRRERAVAEMIKASFKTRGQATSRSPEPG